ncbi:hypothetical protein FRC12_005744 [Ceratobasidium sp. 428]|nr:hypothetical protein FRC12_005744 [Ceratobasidium sp. 428]
MVITGKSTTPEHKKVNPEEIEEMCEEWEGSLQLLWKCVLAASVQDKRMVQDLVKVIIGSTYFWLLGRGSVHSVVNVCADPNRQGNLCSLNDNHVWLLHDIICCPNAKKDHESPIFLKVNSKQIDDEQAEKMCAANTRNVWSDVLLLFLKWKNTICKAVPEDKILLQCFNG